MAQEYNQTDSYFSQPFLETPDTQHASSSTSAEQTLQSSPAALEPVSLPQKYSTQANSTVPITIPENDATNVRGADRPLISQRKFQTERPVLAQRASILQTMRRQTGMVPKSTYGSAWASDSDDDMSSSSSEDEATTKVAKKTLSLGDGQLNGDGASLGQSKSRDKSKRRGSSSWFAFGNESSRARGKVSRRDGRLNLSIKETGGKGYLAKSLGATIQKITAPKHGEEQPLSPLREEESHIRPALPHANTASTTALSFYDKTPIPKLNIVIMVIGSRGDIQPFLSLARILKQVHGHRVRIATHPAFKSFVEKDSGLEFFSVGGDPAEIMAFMVKNPGLIPTAASIKAGEIGRRRQSMYEMFQGFWRACINASDDEKDPENTRMMEDKHPFVADAIIANPVSIAHVHCAERLGIPLHLMFTFPNSPTQQFPHPVTNIKQTNVDPSYTNFISYPLVEIMYVIHFVSVFRVKLLVHTLYPLAHCRAYSQREYMLT